MRTNRAAIALLVRPSAAEISGIFCPAARRESTSKFSARRQGDPRRAGLASQVVLFWTSVSMANKAVWSARTISADSRSESGSICSPVRGSTPSARSSINCLAVTRSTSTASRVNSGIAGRCSQKNNRSELLLGLYLLAARDLDASVVPWFGSAPRRPFHLIVHGAEEFDGQDLFDGEFAPGASAGVRPLG